MPVDPRTIRLLPRRLALRVSSSSQRLPRPTVLRPFRDGFILSCPRSSSEFLRQSSRPTLQPVMPARVSSLFAASPMESTHTGVTHSRYVPSAGFHNLSTAFSTTGFAGLFHPAATSRVPPSRDFSRSAAVPARRRSVPPCRCRPTAHRILAGCPADHGCHDHAPRLRGLAPRNDAFRKVGV